MKNLSARTQFGDVLYFLFLYFFRGTVARYARSRENSRVETNKFPRRRESLRGEIYAEVTERKTFSSFPSLASS